MRAAPLLCSCSDRVLWNVSFPSLRVKEDLVNRRLFFSMAISAALCTPAFAALKAGDRAPDFAASASQAGKEFNFSLRDALKKGPVVVYFYPSAYTGGCDLEAHKIGRAHV